MKNKRGQFYLVAAMIIIAIIVGFAAVTNYAGTKREVRIYDLSEELSIESEQVIDYGILSSEENLPLLLENFTEIYDAYTGEGKEIYFIFGNEEGLFGYTYSDLEVGSIDATIGSTSTRVPIIQRNKEEFEPLYDEGKVIVSVGNITHEFSLKQGQNFYYVISQEIEGEEYVVKN
jgi:hypothetical protein